jgi:hypothetical protein
MLDANKFGTSLGAIFKLFISLQTVAVTMTDDHLQAHVEPTKTTEKDVFEYDSSLSKDLLNDINMDMFADELGFTDYVPLNEEKKVPATKAPVVDVKLLANGKKRATSASKKPTKTPPKRLLSARPKPPDRGTFVTPILTTNR